MRYAARFRIHLPAASVVLTLSDPERGDRPFELGLLSTVHLAEAPYYSSLQDAADGYERVLFELLADESVFEPADAAGARRLRVPLQPAPQLAALAARNQLTTQVGGLDCRRNGWVHADVTRRQLAVQEARLRASSVDLLDSSPLAEPLRRLIAGSAGGGSAPRFLRALSCLLPAPEALLLLDDWTMSRGARLAPGLRALYDALSRLDLSTASRLSFAQTLASGETTQQGSLAGALVRWRNAQAMDEVERALDAGCTRVAMVYGALHMRDMRAKLQSRYRLVRIGDPQWDVAWTIPLPAPAAAAKERATAAGASGAAGASDGYGGAVAEDNDDDVGLREALPPTAALLTLLAIDGSDWIDVVGELLAALVGALSSGLGDASVELVARAGVEEVSLAAALLDGALYLVRHALLYLALSRWAFQPDSRWWAVESGRPRG